MSMCVCFSSASNFTALPPRFARRLLRGVSMSMRSSSILGDVSVAFLADYSFVAAPSRTTSTTRVDNSAAFAHSSAIDTPSMMTSTTLGVDSTLAYSVFCNTPRRTEMVPSSSVLLTASKAGKHPLMILVQGSGYLDKFLTVPR